MKKLIIANWKMNPQTLEEAKKILASLEYRLAGVEHAEVVLAVPFVYLPPLSLHTSRTALAAQNLSWEDAGALTGEISGGQLQQWSIRYAILGHSERRLFLGETDSMVNFKIQAAFRHKITPVLCLGGEEGAVKSAMKTLVTKQFVRCTKDLTPKQLEQIIYAYEPVWAISTMKNSRPADGLHASELIDHIYSLLTRRLGRSRARNVRVLYGGTVNQDNVHEYAQYPQIDGALVGAASLQADNFWNIIKEFSREAIHREGE
jgi:triosephosphate isomerase